jgi:hypothetical protein
MTRPYLIHFDKIGEPALGFIAVAEIGKTLPFEVKRVFWTFFTPEDIVRGRHAHHNTEMILVAAAGKIIVNTEMPGGEKDSFILDKPNTGVYLPRYCWHTMQYTHNAIQLVFASTVYSEPDYIRDYESFRKY